MIGDIATGWLYAFSSRGGAPAKAYLTLFFGPPRSNGRPVMATVSLSYLTTLSGWGAGALVKGFTLPSGEPVAFSDFAMNSAFSPNAIAVTWALSASGAEAYAQANVYFLG